jgi:RecJ-like exonuclease
MTVNHNQSIQVDCDNCGDRGKPTGDKAETSIGGRRPVLKCPTCQARWTTDETRLVGLLIADATAAQGVDHWAVDHQGYYASEWAKLTERDESTVARNVRRAKNEN